LGRFELGLERQHVADAGLRVSVNDKDLLAVIGRQRLGKCEDKGRLSDAALGVHDGDGVTHTEF
jgi:hypothetical protein